MCEYCKLLSGDRKILEEDGKTEVAIGRVNKDYYIEVENDYDIIDIDINYCPFCGRKLSEQNMCADEMFEKMGYEKEFTYYNDNETYIAYTRKSEYASNIEFNLINKTIIVYYKDKKAANITIDLLKVINKKVEELGWIKII